MMRLTGNAGTGKKILANWSIFKYQFMNESILNGIYYFNFSYSFGSTKGTFVVCLKQNDNKEWFIDINTTLNSTSFPKSLGAYNDCLDDSDGLFKLGYILIQKHGSSLINIQSLKFIHSLSQINISLYN